MASPTISGSALTQTWKASTSATVTLTTLAANDLIYLVIAMAHATTLPTVSTVADVAGLTWTKRKAWTVAGTTADIAVEIWTAPSTGVLTADVITVTAGLTVNAGVLIAAGINGTYALATPFDIDAGLPYETQGTNRTTLTAVTFNTTEADDLILGISMGDKSAAYGTVPSGWTTIQQGNLFGTSRFCSCGLYTKSVSAAQSSASFAPNGSATFTALDCIVTADAVTADSPSVAYTLAITTGTYAIAGQTVALPVAGKIAPTTGVYAISGKDIQFSGLRTLSIDTGTYSISGQDTALSSARSLVMATGSYLINGQDILFPTALKVVVETGAYVIAGNAANLIPPLPYHATFAEFSNTGFVDWGAADFDSFLAISQSDESVDVREQTPYVYTFLKQTDDSDADSEGATITGYWDWANDSTSKRVTEPQEIYQFRNGFLVCARRHKMRGRGRQLQLRFDSETGKNFNLLGWAVFYTHNAAQ